jgi:malate dehydrogenase (oxaloacetate-decarboxylating)(NADP+)
MNTTDKGMPRRGLPTGSALLNDPLLNKGTAFSEAERDVLGLHGLLPPAICDLEQQEQRVLENYRRKATDLERYIYLMSLQERNVTLFYRTVMKNLDEMMPIIYTPTVGNACQEFSHIFRRPHGLYISYSDRGRVERSVRNWGERDVRVVVVTDGERILGLGDQGANGMGIPVGKLALYTACAGIAPATCLPVMLDVGTGNEDYLRDPLYMGLRRRRVCGQDYDDFVAEFIEAVHKVHPKALVQFEDFGNATAFRLLEHWRNRICTFNDDIQGTAAVTLAGLLSSLRVTGKSLRQQRLLFLGAGEAGTGIADLLCNAMVDEGARLEDARRACWFVDKKGLVVRTRTDLAPHNIHYAHDAPPTADFLTALRAIEPTAIVGVSTAGKAFNREVIETMSKLNERPIVFALSNPTSKSECSAEEAYTWSKGKAVFASGSPFPICLYEGKTFVPGQSNNVYIFPGVGLGAIACEATRITDRMFLAAAHTLAANVGESDLAIGRIFPALSRIRDISLAIGVAVAEVAFAEGLARIPRPADLRAIVKSKMWQPEYENYLT